MYYDLKSPNILVFQFPSVQESLAVTQGQGYMVPSRKSRAGMAVCLCGVSVMGCLLLLAIVQSQLSPVAHDLLRASLCFLSIASSVYVKIADLGISQILSPGGVMGFKGSPGFMAPEILKYVGTEACTEKVDIYSFAMFLFETISLYYPFEKQNLMQAQIEKLVIDGERPPLQSRVRYRLSWVKEAIEG